MEAKSWEYLPSELLTIILKYVPVEDLVSSVQFVNWQWRNTILHPSFWNDIVFRPPLGMKSDKVMELLRKCPYLKKFEFREGLKYDDIFKTLCQSNKNLTSLAFGSADIGGGISEAVKCFPDLEYLQVPEQVFVKFECLSQFKKLKKLKCSLGIGGNSLSWRRDVETFSENTWPELEDLEIYSEHTGHLISQLVSFRAPHLVSLTLHCVPNYMILEHVKHCKNLERLNLNFLSVDSLELGEGELEKFFVNLKLLTRLQHLCLISFVHRDINVLVKIFDKTNFPALTSIYLKHCMNFSPKVAKSIVLACPRLHVLKLTGGVTVDDNCLQELSKCLSLTHLDVSGCRRVTEVGLKHLANCLKLKQLHLNWMGLITSPSLNHIAKMEQLCVLSLNHNEIDYNHLMVALENLSELRHLYIYETGLDGKALQVKLGHCHVYYTKPVFTHVFMEKLDSLHVQGYTEEVLKHLHACQNVVQLSLDFLSRPSLKLSCFLSVVQGLQKLQSLTIKSFISRDGAGLDYLFQKESFPDLKKLTFEDCVFLNSSVVKLIAQNCSNLEDVSIKGALMVEMESLEALSHLKNITRLDLSGSHCLSLQGVEAIREFKTLKELNLSEVVLMKDDGNLERFSHEAVMMVFSIPTLELVHLDTFCHICRGCIDGKNWKLEVKDDLRILTKLQ